MAKKTAKEMKDKLEKDVDDAIKKEMGKLTSTAFGHVHVVPEIHSPYATTSTLATAGHALAGITGTVAVDYSSDDRMKDLIKQLVYQVLEDENVLVYLSGKVAQYKKKGIAISKLDPTIKDIKVELEAKPEIDFVKELSEI